MFSITRDDGTVEGFGPVLVTESSDDYVAVAAADENAVLFSADHEVTKGDAYFVSWTTFQPGTVRAAWSRWGLTNTSCILRINQQDVSGWTTGGEGRYALPTDFSGGAAVSARKCLPVEPPNVPVEANEDPCVGAGGAVVQTYRYEASGYLFGFFLPAPGSLVGMQDPAGGDRLGPAPMVAAKSAPGTWTFSLLAAASDGQPVLWLLDVPA